MNYETRLIEEIIRARKLAKSYLMMGVLLMLAGVVIFFGGTYMAFQHTWEGAIMLWVLSAIMLMLGVFMRQASGEYYQVAAQNRRDLSDWRKDYEG